MTNIKSYAEKSIEDWNVKNLTDYMCDEHRRRFNCDYVPYRSWNVERGLIGKIFGTKTKAGKYDKRLIKDFVDHCFSTYRSNAQYPGISFGFMWIYRKNEFQSLQKKFEAKSLDDENSCKAIDESVLEWLSS